VSVLISVCESICVCVCVCVYESIDLQKKVVLREGYEGRVVRNQESEIEGRTDRDREREEKRQESWATRRERMQKKMNKMNKR